MRFLEKPGQIPIWVSRLFWPLAWRSLLLAVVVLWGLRGDLNISFWDSPNLDSMFYAVSSVIGILAAFLTTSLTILATSDSKATMRIKEQGGAGLVVTFLYAVVTLLVSALVIAVIGPAAASTRWASYVLIGIVAIAFIEILIVTFYTYLSLVDKG
ncbi:hypothetical protein EAH68_00200 [Corynebacterium hylobatis]|uniref:Uncharacterized protein n=1 Tax=Corynebacterium hylobatis TaxID=1859290 RepID=A0A3S0B651_9CORY|nr:hypothetical protein [Corynebacterium hylobatis]RSZ66019.1 hypothetical protein EAH68_00200 [Corynebacterium hylobatis]